MQRACQASALEHRQATPARTWRYDPSRGGRLPARGEGIEISKNSSKISPRKSGTRRLGQNRASPGVSYAYKKFRPAARSRTLGGKEITTSSVEKIACSALVR